MSRRVVLWIAFVAVHAMIAASGFVFPNQPMGDVYNVYEPWSTQALTGGPIVGIDQPWVYPQLALLPMLLAHLFSWIGGYTVGWAILVTALDALALSVLLGDARSAGRARAAWFWLAAQLLLGPVGMYRIDAVTVPLAVMASLWLVRRTRLAAALLTAATWMKVWPAALLGAAVVAVRRRAEIVLVALAVSAAVAAVVVAVGGAGNLLGFVSAQSSRGLQVEAPVSMPFLLAAVWRLPGFSVEYDADIVTYQVTGPGTDAVAVAMTPLLALGCAATLLRGGACLRRGARFAALYPTLALALVTVLIVANKVGSPQFVCWLIAPVVFGLVLDRRRMRAPALLVLATCGLTQLVFPLLYDGITDPRPGPVAVLVVRNVLLSALLVWTVVRLRQTPARSRSAVPARGTR